MLRLLDSTQVGSGHKDSSVTSIPRTCVSCRLIPDTPDIYDSVSHLRVSYIPVSLYAEKPIHGIYPFVSCVPCTSLRHTYARHENPCFRHFRLPPHHVMERARNCRVPDTSDTLTHAACRLAAQGLRAPVRAMLHSVTNRTYNTNGLVRRSPRRHDDENEISRRDMRAG